MTTGVCPVCSGSKRQPAGDFRFTHTYDKETDTVACQNCGGQTMWGKPTGLVPLRPDGTPCSHEYKGVEAGRCYVRYICKHCSDVYGIDSSD